MSKVKNLRLKMLLYDYELFTMLSHKFMANMYTNITKIVTLLHALGWDISNSKNVSKI